jgi:hypothetical protein
MAKKKTNEYFGYANDLFAIWPETIFPSAKGFSDIFGEKGATNVKQINEAFIKGLGSYMKAYDGAVKGMVDIIREGFEAGRKSMTGEEIEADALLKAIGKAYDNAGECMIDILSDTPFEGIKEVDQAIKQSFESLADERKIVKAFFKEICDFNTKLGKLSTAAAKEATNSIAAVKENGTISVDGYKKIISDYGETVKQALENLDIAAAWLPDYKEKVNDTINLAKKNIDMLTSWMEISMKSIQAMNKSAEDIYKTGETVFAEKDTEAGFRAWTEMYEKTARDFIESAQYNMSIPKFITDWTDCIKLANEQYKKAMTLPSFVTEAELSKISEEVAQLKEASEKSAE